MDDDQLSSTPGQQPPPAPIRRSIRMRSRLPLVVLGLLLVNQVFNPARIWVGILLALGVLVLFCYLWARALSAGLSGQRAARGVWVLVGDVLSEQFTVTNSAALPALWVEVLDHSNLPGYRPDWVAYAGANDRQSYRAEGRCQRRGVFSLGPWELRSGDPLGLFQVVVAYPDVRSILVYPRAMVLPDLRLLRGLAPGLARTQRRTHQTTTTVATVRPYTPGDPLRAIHWRKTAHMGGVQPGGLPFMVKQFDLEPSGDLWMVLDLDPAGHAGQGVESTLEYAITLTASLATQMLAENRRVGLAAPGCQLPPQSGQLQLWRILEALAQAEPVPGYPLDRLLRDLHPASGRGRTIVVVTPSTDPAWTGELLHLAERGNAPAALLLDAASFRAPDAPEQAAAAARLAGVRALLSQHGVPSHLIDRSFVFRPVFQVARTRTELRTLSGTGRVIAVEVEEVL
jgi:uncharacterized protein (DUF58 family)